MSKKKKPEKVSVDRMYVCSPPQNACGGCFACSFAGRKPTGAWVALSKSSSSCLLNTMLLLAAPTALVALAVKAVRR